MVSDPQYVYDRLPRESHKIVRRYIAYLASIDAYRLAKIGKSAAGQQLIDDNHVLKYSYQPTVFVSLARFHFYTIKSYLLRTPSAS